MFHFRCWPLDCLTSEKKSGEPIRLLMNKKYRLELPGSEAWKAAGALYDLAEGLRRNERGLTGMFRDPLDVDRALIVIWGKKVVRVHVEAIGLSRRIRCLSRFDSRQKHPWRSIRNSGPFYLHVRFQDLEQVAHLLQSGR